LNKEPIFEIKSIEPAVAGMKYSIKGIALDRINEGDKLYFSHQMSQDDHFVVECFEIEGRKIKRAYAFMEVTIIANGTFSINPEKYLFDLVEEYIAKIDFQQAKSIAENSAFSDLNQFRTDPQIALLSDDFIEGECCWIFFRNKEITGPPEKVLTWSNNYVVTKKGNIFSIGDRSYTPEKFNEYLCRYSSHLKRTKE
jgi:hypothetical protein